MSAPGTARRTGRRPVVGADGPAPRFFVSDLDGAPRWVGGLLAGLQAALLPLSLVVLPSVAAYVVTSADPSNAGIGWTHAVSLGARIWLLAHGVPMTAEGVSITPLGLTFVALWTCALSARRSGYATGSALGAGVACYVGVALVVALACGVGGAGMVLAVLGSAVLSAIGLSAGLLRRPEARRPADLARPVLSRIPAPVRAGVTAGVMLPAALLLLAALLATVWSLAGRATIVDIVRGLGVDLVGGLVLAFGELAFLPNLVLWAFAWIVGPGFAVGDGTSFTVGGVVSAPLPAVPLLGALPQPGMTGGVLLGLPVLTLVVGAAGGWWLRRRFDSRGASDPWWAAVAYAVTAGTVVAVLMALSAGGIGPGRMAVLGPAWLPVGALVAAASLVGGLLVLLPGDRHVRAGVAAWARRTWGEVRGTAPSGTSVPEPGAERAGPGTSSDAVADDRGAPEG